MVSLDMFPSIAHKNIFLDVVLVVADLVFLITKGVLIIDRHNFDMRFVFCQYGHHFIKSREAVGGVGDHDDTVAEMFEQPVERISSSIS